MSFDRSVIDFGPGRGNKRRSTPPIHPELRTILVDALEGATSDYVIEHSGERVGSVKTGVRNAAALLASMGEGNYHLITCARYGRNGKIWARGQFYMNQQAADNIKRDTQKLHTIVMWEEWQ